MKAGKKDQDKVISMRGPLEKLSPMNAEITSLRRISSSAVHELYKIGPIVDTVHDD
jgi:hypothetical protein